VLAVQSGHFEPKGALRTSHKKQRSSQSAKKLLRRRNRPPNSRF
jgi:hypothetical protein